MKTTIEIIVSPLGETRLETKGFAGASCQDASHFIEKALGEVSIAGQLTGPALGSGPFGKAVGQRVARAPMLVERGPANRATDSFEAVALDAAARSPEESAPFFGIAQDQALSHRLLSRERKGGGPSYRRGRRKDQEHPAHAGLASRSTLSSQRQWT